MGTQTLWLLKCTALKWKGLFLASVLFHSALAHLGISVIAVVFFFWTWLPDFFMSIFTSYFPKCPPPHLFKSLIEQAPVCRRKRWNDFEHYRFFILNHTKRGGLVQSLSRVEHLIILALRLIGVRLNLFQVPDIINLIPGITRHLKLLSPGKADNTDYSSIAFLVLSFCLFLSCAHKPITHIWTDVLCMVKRRFAVSCRVRTKQLYGGRLFLGF